MPPKRINKLAGTGIILGNACCFCQRPADDAAPGGLGALIQCTSGNTALKYHEACAAYSMVIAMNRPKHGSIHEWRVNSEAQRGSNVICVLCRKPGATIKCSGKCCPRSYHLPCAREAAMKSNANLRVDESMRPVFSAVNSSTSINDDTNKNNLGSLALACADHAREAISNPLREPAGLWFEKCGGWDCHCPELASREFLMSDEELQAEEEKLAAAGAGPAARQAEGSSDQTETNTLLVDRLGSTAAAPAAAAKLPPAKPSKAAAVSSAAAPTAAPSPTALKSHTFDIPDHIWEVSACVQGPLPPLRPKEGRVLGVTLSAPVFQAYRKTMTSFLIAAKKNSQLRHVVPLQNSNGTINKTGLRNIAKSVQKVICTAAKADNIKKVKPELPDTAPCHRALEAFCISKDDPRAGLAAEPGALGVRVRPNAEPIKPYELLGIYGGLQLFFDDHIKLLDDVQLAKSVGLRCKQQLATKVESYTADEEQAQHAEHFEESVPEVKYLEEATGGWFKNHSSWLLTTAFLYGNMTCLINDPTLDPFRSATDRHPAENTTTTAKNNKRSKNNNSNKSKDSGVASGDGKRENSFLMAEPNCKMMSCLIRGWPFIILVSTAQIRPGQELLYLYNGKEAHECVTIDGYWSTLRDKIALETDALKALDREEQLLQKMEKARLEKEEKDREIAALRAQLLMAKETFSSSGHDLGSVEVGSGTFAAGGGSAVIGDVRRNAQTAAAGAAGGGGGGGNGSGSGDATATAAKVSEDVELLAVDIECGGGGSGVTTTPNGELSVLTGSVSTEDINSLVEKDEVDATGDVATSGGGALHLANQHSLVLGCADVGGSYKHAPTGGTSIKELEVIDMTMDGDDDGGGSGGGGGGGGGDGGNEGEIKVRSVADVAPIPAPGAVPAPDLTVPYFAKTSAKTTTQKNLKKHDKDKETKFMYTNGRSQIRSRSRERERPRNKRRVSYSPDRRYDMSPYRSHFERGLLKPSSNQTPGRGRGRSRGRGRGRGAPLASNRGGDGREFSRDFRDRRDYDDGRGGRSRKYSRSRSRSRTPEEEDLRKTINRSKKPINRYRDYYNDDDYKAEYKYEDDEYNRHERYYSRSRSRSRERNRSRSWSRERNRERDTSRDRGGGGRSKERVAREEREDRHRYASKEKITSQLNKNKKSGVDSSKRKKAYPPLKEGTKEIQHPARIPNVITYSKTGGIEALPFPGGDIGPELVHNKTKKFSFLSLPTAPQQPKQPSSLMHSSPSAAPLPTLPILPDPESITMTVPLAKPRFIAQPTQMDSLASFPLIPPLPTAAAAHHNYPHHPHPEAHQKMSFVIPSAISDIPKQTPETTTITTAAAAKNIIKSSRRQKGRDPAHPPPSSRRSPRPVLVGDIHPPPRDPSQNKEQASSSRPQSQPSQPSTSDAPSGAWHQIMSPRKPTAPSWNDNGVGNATATTNNIGEVYDPTQAYTYLQKDHSKVPNTGMWPGDVLPPPPAPPAAAVAAAEPIPWGYVNMHGQMPTSRDEGIPGSKKGWYD